MSRRIIQVLSGVILGLVAVAVILLVQGIPEAPHQPGLVQQVDPDPYPASDFTLTSHDERSVSLQDFRGRTVVLFFGFSHCPDVCPATLLNLSTALQRLDSDRRDGIQGLLVTVDPERDTPERLRQYMNRFDPSLIGLTGSLEEIREVADAYGVFFQKVDEASGAAGMHDHGEHANPGMGEERLPPQEMDVGAEEGGTDENGYTVDHTARAFIIDGEGRVVGSFAPFTSPDEMTEKLQQVAGNR